MKSLILILYLSFFVKSTFAKDCPDGMYLVQGHHRQAHYRGGTYVRGTNVSQYCKHYRSDGALKN